MMRFSALIEAVKAFKKFFWQQVQGMRDKLASIRLGRRGATFKTRIGSERYRRAGPSILVLLYRHMVLIYIEQSSQCFVHRMMRRILHRKCCCKFIAPFRIVDWMGSKHGLPVLPSIERSISNAAVHESQRS